jgi:hypothetical protein
VISYLPKVLIAKFILAHPCLLSSLLYVDNVKGSHVNRKM